VSLIQAWPDSISVENKQGRTPLEFIIKQWIVHISEDVKRSNDFSTSTRPPAGLDLLCWVVTMKQESNHIYLWYNTTITEQYRV
jgi:hypothetical protein